VNLRDVLEHFDDYAVGTGMQVKPTGGGRVGL
jgi:hypothetical protein